MVAIRGGDVEEDELGVQLRRHLHRLDAADLAEDDPVYAWRERLLDAFDGLARLLQVEPQAPSLTRNYGRALTPEYASPELLRSEPLIRYDRTLLGATLSRDLVGSFLRFNARNLRDAAGCALASSLMFHAVEQEHARSQQWLRTGVALDCIRGVMECEVCVVLVPSRHAPTIGEYPSL